MSSDFTPEEMAKVTQQLRNTMLGAAVLHFDELDARTVTVLQQQGFLKTANLPAMPEPEAAILADRKHPDRLPVSHGPLVFVAQGGNQANRMVYSMVDLVLASQSSVRSAAVEHFRHLSDKQPGILTPRSQDALKASGEAASCEDPEEWRPAAVSLSDILKDDWLCNAAGVRQSIEMHFEQGVENYLDKVLRPSISSLDTINLGFWSPSTETDDIERRVVEIAQSSKTLPEALNVHYAQFGTIPLDPRLSLSRVVNEWMKNRGGADDLWKVLWAWADSIRSPLPRYHVCQILLCNPSLIQKGSETQLWSEISEVLNSGLRTETDQTWTQAWQIRCELAQHYACYIALQLPGAEGERIARSAWWLAEQVAGLFAQSPEVLQNVRRGSVGPQLLVTGLLTNCAHPQIRPSRFYCATVSTNSVWSLSLLTDLAEGIAVLGAANATEDQRGQIRQCFTGFLFNSLPLRPSEGKEKAYAFDRTIMASAKTWCEAETESAVREGLSTLCEFSSTMLTPDAFVELAEKAGTDDPGHQAVFSSHLKAMAYTGEAPLDTVWQRLEDKEWGQKFLTTANELIVVNTVDALVEIERQNNDKWTWRVPHFIADGCEAAPDGSDRQSLLFDLVVAASMSTDTVSAIQRLLTGGHRGCLAKDVERWRKRIQDIRDWAPLWIRARFNAIIATLHLP